MIISYKKYYTFLEMVIWTNMNTKTDKNNNIEKQEVFFIQKKIKLFKKPTEEFRLKFRTNLTY